MKDVDDMTAIEAAKELNSVLLDYVPSEKHGFYESANIEDYLRDLTYKFEDEGSLDIDMRNFTALIVLTDEEGDEYEIITNLISGDFFDALYGYGYDDYITFLEYARYRTEQPSIDTRCATFTLEQIQEELTDAVLQKVFKGHHVVSFDYFLANPRKDVIEWALAHKDELGIGGVSSEFIEKYQAIPELKELIFQSLHPPINQ